MGPRPSGGLCWGDGGEPWAEETTWGRGRFVADPCPRLCKPRGGYLCSRPEPRAWPGVVSTAGRSARRPEPRGSGRILRPPRAVLVLSEPKRVLSAWLRSGRASPLLTHSEVPPDGRCSCELGERSGLLPGSPSRSCVGATVCADSTKHLPQRTRGQSPGHSGSSSDVTAKQPSGLERSTS